LDCKKDLNTELGKNEFTCFIIFELSTRKKLWFQINAHRNQVA